MTDKAVISIIRMMPGLSKSDLFAELDKRGDTRATSTQYAQIRELLRKGKLEDRAEGRMKTALYVAEAEETPA